MFFVSFLLLLSLGPMSWQSLSHYGPILSLQCPPIVSLSFFNHHKNFSSSNTSTMARLRTTSLLSAIMTTVVAVSFFTKLRPVVAFQAPLSTSRYFSNAAYGRTTFRHLRGDLESWKMTSKDETETQTPAATPDLEKYLNNNNLDDQVFSAMSADGGLKVTVATVRNLLNEMMIQHSMNPVAGDALGRATICGLLASNGMQEEQMFQLSMKGDGPLRGVVSIVTGKGEARGYVGNPSLSDDFTLSEAIGAGTVQVVKNHPDWPRPYNGITGIRHGDIDRDVGIYLAESEQRSCALAAATSFNGILCTSAGGYLVERLPDCSPETMQHMEKNLGTLVQMNGEDIALPANLLLEGKTPVDIATILLDGLGMEPLNQITPKAFCECSEEKLFRSLRLLPREEVDDVLKEEGKIEARCQFCGKVYRMGPDEVAKRFAEASGDPSKDEDFEKELENKAT
jgi:molecular chaperone Hsp33